MAQISDTIALLSIHPRHAEAILNGSKTVEFRKKRLREGVRWVVLYATKPVGKLVGIFQLQDHISGSPASVWSKCGSKGGILKREYLEYFNESEVAVGFLIARTWRFSRPEPLASLGRELSPPQSFRYLNGTSLRKVDSWAECGLRDLTIKDDALGTGVSNTSKVR
jgi:predicted transcriptional regulator